MIEFNFHGEDGVLMIHPQSSLEAEDFKMLTAFVDPIIERNEKLNGIMISADHFPGWKDLAGFVSHFRFVKDHHKNVKRVAMVGDGAFVTILPEIAKHFVNAEVKHFDHNDKQEALHWLKVH